MTALRILPAWLLFAGCAALAQPAPTPPAPATAPAAAMAGPDMPPAAPAAPARGSIIIEINGTISARLVPQIREAFRAVDQQRFPSGALLVLNSGGGDGIAAMEIGRIARAAGAHAFVRGRCVSACVLVLAGSVVRGVAEGAQIGIHQGRILNERGVEVDIASSPKAASMLQAAEGQMADFLREMGLPEDLYRSMRAVPSAAVRYLDRDEMRRLGLLGFDANYLAGRVARGTTVYRVAAPEFEQRTLQAGSVCPRPDAKPPEVLQCYSRVMRTGE